MCSFYYGNHLATYEVKVLVAQSCLTLWDPMDYSPPGSFVHGILQARILEWVAILFSRSLPDPEIKPRYPACQADSLPSEPPGKWQHICVSNHVVCLILTQSYMSIPDDLPGSHTTPGPLDPLEVNSAPPEEKIFKASLQPGDGACFKTRGLSRKDPEPPLKSALWHVTQDSC